MPRPNLWAHPKFRAFQRRLRRHLGQTPVDPEAVAVGILECLWRVAYENGNPVLGDADAVADHAGWYGDAAELCDMLSAAPLGFEHGFLEEDAVGVFRIHDLEANAPDYVRKRRRREDERRRRHWRGAEEDSCAKESADDGPRDGDSGGGQWPVSDRSVTGQAEDDEPLTGRRPVHDRSATGPSPVSDQSVTGQRPVSSASDRSVTGQRLDKSAGDRSVTGQRPVGVQSLTGTPAPAPAPAPAHAPARPPGRARAPARARAGASGGAGPDGRAGGEAEPIAAAESRGDPSTSFEDYARAVVHAAWGGRRHALRSDEAALAERWQTEGYPLEVVVPVLRRLALNLARHRPDDPEAASLRYFADAVEREVGAWLLEQAAEASRPPPWPEPDPVPEEGRDAWQRLLAEARRVVSTSLGGDPDSASEVARTWFSPLRFQGLDAAAIHVWAPNAHFVHTLRTKGWLQAASDRLQLGRAVRFREAETP